MEDFYPSQSNDTLTAKLRNAFETEGLLLIGGPTDTADMVLDAISTAPAEWTGDMDEDSPETFNPTPNIGYCLHHFPNQDIVTKRENILMTRTTCPFAASLLQKRVRLNVSNNYTHKEQVEYHLSNMNPDHVLWIHGHHLYLIRADLSIVSVSHYSDLF
jgi:hypothetical protein